ncbi:MAG: hypothetical protein KC910_30350 [Candidatus Eremiobacteraeota bacterium]|nr:hypothetical protein [Candidatus Eremiobacteraeota bacterium]
MGFEIELAPGWVEREVSLEDGLVLAAGDGRAALVVLPVEGELDPAVFDDDAEVDKLAAEFAGGHEITEKKKFELAGRRALAVSFIDAPEGEPAGRGLVVIVSGPSIWVMSSFMEEERYEAALPEVQQMLTTFKPAR